jgi:hypothetical protein
MGTSLSGQFALILAELFTSADAVDECFDAVFSGDPQFP